MLTQERLKELLYYDPETGVFIRLITATKCPSGAIAGCKSKSGYITIKIDGRGYLAHRLAWFYMTGEWPKKFIDHKDRNKVNNIFQNLRDVSQSVNQQNKDAPYTNSKSGVLGVSLDGQKFVANIRVNGRQIFLGKFNKIEDARNAYLAAKLKYHPGYQ